MNAKSTKPENRVFHTVDQVAEILGESPKSTRRKLKAGELPYYRFGKSIRIGDGDLRAYCENHRGE